MSGILFFIFASCEPFRFSVQKQRSLFSPYLMLSIVFLCFLFRFSVKKQRNLFFSFLFFSISLAFCQGLAFYLCVSALMMKRSVLLRKTSCASGERLASLVFRLRRTLAPSALDTRASRSWLISHGPC